VDSGSGGRNDISSFQLVLILDVIALLVRVEWWTKFSGSVTIYA